MGISDGSQAGSAQRPILGALGAYAKTGSEGTWWNVIEDRAADERGQDWSDIRRLGEGDRLTVFAPDGSVLWSGTIRCDLEARWRPRPGNPDVGQQEVLGLWVHWLQASEEPEVWAGMFVRSPPLRASLLPACDGGGRRWRSGLRRHR